MKKIILSVVLWSSVLCTLVAQTSYTPTRENLKAREAFQDEKFGIFLHWGLYSMLASGEWTMTNDNLNYKEYAKLAEGFYPSKFDAAQWVSDVKQSGAKYICITTRHHDGFSMFNSQWTDFNIVKATPFHRDILKELAQECKRQGIKLHLYYSHIDWSREDAVWGGTGRGTGRPNPQGNWPSYYQFMNHQLTELLTQYGTIGAVWFDGWWDQKPDFDWQLPEQYALIHKLQPACLIGNNHHHTPFEGEDFQMFERDLPGENQAGFSGQAVSHLPLETCETMNGMWGYKIADQNYKSTKELIHYLVKAAGKDANLLLNIGPQPNGAMPDTAVQRLREMGQWLAIYGETLYGTRNGIIEPQPWGVSTQKKNKLYLHILNLQDHTLSIPVAASQIRKIERFVDQSPISFSPNGEGVTLELKEIPQEIDCVLQVTLKE
ncbi:MAG: alpha-L-fucosidase [Alistipes sp.]|nr:alpha-L-fucosidase [Alistipes sp.]